MLCNYPTYFLYLFHVIDLMQAMVQDTSNYFNDDIYNIFSDGMQDIFLPTSEFSKYPNYQSQTKKMRLYPEESKS